MADGGFVPEKTWRVRVLDDKTEIEGETLSPEAVAMLLNFVSERYPDDFAAWARAHPQPDPLPTAHRDRVVEDSLAEVIRVAGVQPLWVPPAASLRVQFERQLAVGRLAIIERRR